MDGQQITAWTRNQRPALNNRTTSSATRVADAGFCPVTNRSDTETWLSKSGAETCFAPRSSRVDCRRNGTTPASPTAPVVASAPSHVERVREVVFDALDREQVNQLEGIAERLLGKLNTDCLPVPRPTGRS